MNFLSRLLVIGFIGLISACGFRLRGDEQISSRLNPIYLESGQLDSQQLVQIRRALKQAKADLTSDPESGNRLWLKVSDLKTQKIASSGLSEVELYRVTMQLNFTIKNTDNDILLEDRITQSRELQLDTDNVLSHQQLIDKAGDQLLMNLIRSMIFQLNHFKNA